MRPLEKVIADVWNKTLEMARTCVDEGVEYGQYQAAIVSHHQGHVTVEYAPLGIIQFTARLHHHLVEVGRLKRMSFHSALETYEVE